MRDNGGGGWQLFAAAAVGAYGNGACAGWSSYHDLASTAELEQSEPACLAAHGARDVRLRPRQAEACCDFEIEHTDSLTVVIYFESEKSHVDDSPNLCDCKRR